MLLHTRITVRTLLHTRITVWGSLFNRRFLGLPGVPRVPRESSWRLDSVHRHRKRWTLSRKMASFNGFTDMTCSENPEPDFSEVCVGTLFRGTKLFLRCEMLWKSRTCFCLRSAKRRRHAVQRNKAISQIWHALKIQNLLFWGLRSAAGTLFRGTKLFLRYDMLWKSRTCFFLRSAKRRRHAVQRNKAISQIWHALRIQNLIFLRSAKRRRHAVQRNKAWNRSCPWHEPPLAWTQGSRSTNNSVKEFID